MEAKICPEQEQIQRWLQGNLPGHDSVTVSQHVSTCSHCQAVSDQLKSTLVDETVDFDPHVTATATGGEPKPKRLSGLESTRSRGADFSQPVIFGDYELLGEIARGGMGVVYRAKQRKANRTVALKMILAGGLADREEIDRFYAEAESAANLDHPNIVPVFDVGEAEGRHFFSMAFIQGQSLSDVVREQPLESRRAAELMVDVAAAVHYAHGRGIIHRDLKPANILLDKEGTPKVTDFGLAKRTEADTSLTVTGQVMGTPSYMPPEQATGASGQIGPLSDVYSLGAVLYHLLTGRPPFRAASMMETLDQVVNQDPVSAKILNPTVARDLDTITLKALQKAPANRYASAEDFRDDLVRFLQQRPIKARRTSTLERSYRWARRNRLIAALLLATTLTVLVALAVSSYSAIRYRAIAATELQLRQEEQKLRAEMSDTLYRAQLSVVDDVLEKPHLQDFAGNMLFHWYPGNPKYSRFNPNTDRDLRGWEWYFLYSVTERVTIPIPQQTLAVDVSKQSLMGFGMGNSFGVIRYNQEQGGITWNAHQQNVISIQFTPDGNTVATGSLDGIARVWDVKTRKRLADLEHSAPVGSLSFNHDGTMLATHGRDGRLVVWNVDQQTNIKELGPQDGISTTAACSISPDGETIAVGGIGDNAHSVRVLTFPELQEVHAFAGVHELPVESLCWNPGGGQIATCSADRTAKVWDLADKRLVCTFDQHDLPVYAVDWHPDGNSIASGGEDMEVFTWDATSGKRLEKYGRAGGEIFTAKSLAWDPNGNMLVTALSHGGLDLVNLAGPRAILKHQVGKRRGAEVASIYWQPKTNLLSATLGEEAIEWNVAAKSSKPAARLQNWSSDGVAKSFFSDGQLTVLVKNRAVLKTPLSATPIRMLWSPQGRKLAIQFPETVQVYDADSADGLKELLHVDPVAKGQIVSCAFSHDGTKFLVGTSLGEIIIVSSQSGEKDISMRLGLKGHQPNRVRALAWKPNSSLFAIAGSNGYFYLYDYDTLPRTKGEKLNDRGVSAHQSHLRALAWNPDGTRMASASADRTVKIWDLDVKSLEEVGAKNVLTLSHESEVRDVRWHPQGKRIASLTDAGEITVFDASHGYKRAAYFDANPDMLQWSDHD